MSLPLGILNLNWLIGILSEMILKHHIIGVLIYALMVLLSLLTELLSLFEMWMKGFQQLWWGSVQDGVIWRNRIRWLRGSNLIKGFASGYQSRVIRVYLLCWGLRVDLPCIDHLFWVRGECRGQILCCLLIALFIITK